jgi:cytochrome d ubiquinol oxidase subunit II
MTLDLPTIWAGLIALAVFMYVVMDGFDLGIGILFPFTRSVADRDTMMNSVAPVWDGNETWLVLGGGGLFAAFPLAYSILMPALYLPVLIMLLALILRGVAFEFRFQGRHHGRRLWTVLFSAGSITAALAQGLILGGFIQGVTVHASRFAGGPFDWLTPYTLLVACGLVVGYALLGATWLVLKTESELHGDARRWAGFAAGGAAALLAAVSIATLFVHPQVAARWGLTGAGFDWSKFLPLSPIPLVGLAGLIAIALGLRAKSHWLPFLGAFLIYLSGYIGLAVGFAPHIVPYAVTYEEAAAPANAQMLMLVGALVALPLILGYTAWVYWVFRGKVADEGYHGS